MKRPKAWVWAVVFMSAAAILLALVIWPRGSGSTTAEVWQNGSLTARLDLTQNGSWEFISQSGGRNTVEVRSGQVFVTSADCPDQICVKHEEARPGSPIVCLPNRLVVSLTEEAQTDATTG